MGDLDRKPFSPSIDESSPLMAATRPPNERGQRPHVGVDESSKNALYMLLLTLSIGG